MYIRFFLSFCLFSMFHIMTFAFCVMIVYWFLHFVMKGHAAVSVILMKASDKLANVTVLLSGNYCESMPSVINDLVAITTLDLSSCSLSGFTSGVSLFFFPFSFLFFHFSFFPFPFSFFSFFLFPFSFFLYPYFILVFSSFSFIF